MKKYFANKNGRYGNFGGRYIPELLIKPIQELEIAFSKILKDKNFQRNLKYILESYAGRPTPLTEVKRFTHAIGGNARIFLKREDLLHTGAHKLNNALGVCWLGKWEKAVL